MKRGPLDAWLVPKSEMQPSPSHSTPSSTAASASPPDPVLPRVKADYRSIPAHSLGTLLYLTDFAWTFRKLLKLGEVSVPDLKASIESGGKEMKSLLRALVRELVLDFLLKASDTSVLPARLHLLHTLKSYLNLTFISDRITLTLAQEVLLFSLDAEDNAQLIEQLETFPLESNLYSTYTYQEKLEILVNLVDLVAASSAVHDVLGLRMEEKKELTQKKTELTSQMRALGKDPAVLDQKALLKAEVKRLSAAIRAIPLRTEPLGYDRVDNCYYRFGFDPSRVFVCRSGEEEYWFCYQSRDLQRKLVRALKQPCESALKSALERVLVEEAAETQMDTAETEGTLEGDSGVVSREEAIEKLVALERLVWSCYDNTGKQWDTQEAADQWKQQVLSCTSPEAFGELLQAFARKANAPLRQGNSRKGSTRLWQDCSEGLSVWTSLCQGAQNYSDQWLLTCTLEAVVETGMRKKPAVLSQKDLG